MSLLVVDIETDSLDGPGNGGNGHVLEIGIAELDGTAVRPVWGTVVRQPAADRHAWIFTHDGATLTWDEVQQGMPEQDAVQTYRDIVAGRNCVSWNEDFDFGRFLLSEPWSDSGSIKPVLLCDPMIAASNCCVCGALGLESFPDKWPSADEAYLYYCRGYDLLTGAICDGPAGYHKEHHRALDDAVYEAYIIREMIGRGHYSLPKEVAA